MSELPDIGEIVHYVQDCQRNPGGRQAAIVCGHEHGALNLAVFDPYGAVQPKRMRVLWLGGTDDALPAYGACAVQKSENQKVRAIGEAITSKEPDDMAKRKTISEKMTEAKRRSGTRTGSTKSSSTATSDDYAERRKKKSYRGRT